MHQALEGRTVKQHTLPLVHLQYLQKSTKGMDSTLAAYIMAHMSELPKLTIADLAEQTHTSYATVCRFLKKMGVSGFRELKQLLSDERNTVQPEIPSTLALNQENKERLSFAQINQQIRDFSLSIIENCCRTLTPQQIESICHLFAQAKSVYFVGVGTSAITAQYAYSRFFRMIRACDVGNDPILSKMKASLLRKGDVLFAVSSSGRTKNILEMARLAKDGGATIISLCDYAHSPLSALSDVSICTSLREASKTNDIVLPLLQGQITIVNIIYASLHHLNSKQAVLDLQHTLEVVSNDRVQE